MTVTVTVMVNNNNNKNNKNDWLKIYNNMCDVLLHTIAKRKLLTTQTEVE